MSVYNIERNHKMSCRKVKALLNRHLDGETSKEENRIIKSHLSECAPCREVLMRLCAVDRLLMQSPVPPKVPDDFANRVIARAEQHYNLNFAVLQFRQSFSPALRVAAALTLIIGLGIGGLMSLNLTEAQAKQSKPETKEIMRNYGLDYFTETPEGSLADAYLTLASTGNGKGE